MHSFVSKTHILGIFTPFRCSKTSVWFCTTKIRPKTHSLMLAKTGIKVDLMHKFMPPGPFLVFWKQTCPIHYFRSKTNFLGGLVPFHCCTGQIVKTGYRLHTRHSHYSKTFNKGIHTMSFVKRQIAKTSIGSIQGTSICLRNRFLFFCNEHAQSTTIGPKPMFWEVSRYFVDDPDLLRKLVSGCL